MGICLTDEELDDLDYMDPDEAYDNYQDVVQQVLELQESYQNGEISLDEYNSQREELRCLEDSFEVRFA